MKQKQKEDPLDDLMDEEDNKNRFDEKENLYLEIKDILDLTTAAAQGHTRKYLEEQAKAEELEKQLALEKKPSMKKQDSIALKKTLSITSQRSQTNKGQNLTYYQRTMNQKNEIFRAHRQIDESQSLSNKDFKKSSKIKNLLA